MKKFALVSDLHLEFWRKVLFQKQTVNSINRNPTMDQVFNHFMDPFIEFAVENKCDALVVAGDIFEGHVKKPRVSKSHDLIDIITVPGNHDFYKDIWPSFDEQVLSNDNYVATTLWTNFWDLDKEIASRIFRSISDLYAIYGSSSDAVRDRYYESLQEVEKLKKEIVITHFPPHISSLSEEYAGSILNPYFINDLGDDWFKENNNIGVWVCGHTHKAHEYRVHDTLVVCNPLGYPNENYTHENYTDYKPLIVYKADDGYWYVQ